MQDENKRIEIDDLYAERIGLQRKLTEAVLKFLIVGSASAIALITAVLGKVITTNCYLQSALICFGVANILGVSILVFMLFRMYFSVRHLDKDINALNNKDITEDSVLSRDVDRHKNDPVEISLAAFSLVSMAVGMVLSGIGVITL